MTPRKTHLVILGLLCSVPALAGGFLFVTGTRSHSTYSSIPLAIGAALLLGAAGYAVRTSAIVWKWGTSPRRVIGAHGLVVGLGLLAFLFRRWASFFS